MVNAAPTNIAVAAASSLRSDSGGTGGLSLNPNDATALPGGALLTQLANGIGHYALFVAMVGVVIGAVMWAFGHYSHNYQQALNGRKGVLVSALAAVLIGSAPYMISFFLKMGQGVNS